MRRTKIVATLGPASGTSERIGELIKAGVDVVRLNQSHGDRAWHEAAFKAVRETARRLGRAVAVMVDLSGPKMRIGRVADGRVELAAGSKVTLSYGPDGVSDAKRLFVPVREIVKDVHGGDRILLDDGNVILKVVSKSRGRANCHVVAGGPISDHKGVNLPGVRLSVSSVTEKDLDDLRWAAKVGAEYVAVSFVRRGEDITAVRSALHEAGSDIHVVAKIEKPEALERLDEIAGLADALMVARGDLGVEMPLEEVPVSQQRIISAAHGHDIPVIVATQMLESMTDKPRPTRAEVSDVAGAIFGGTDAVMLSGETAVGRYPVESVRQMAAIAETAEKHLETSGGFRPVFSTSDVYAIADSVCHGAYSAARDLSAAAVFVSTTSGRTALLFSKYRFAGTLVGASDDQRSVRRMALYWGVNPVRVRKCRDHHRLLSEIVDASLEKRLVSRGDMVVMIAGSPLGKTGATNLMLVRRIKPDSDGGRRDIIRGDVPRGTLQVDRDLCIACGACVGVCPVSIFTMEKGKVRLRRGNLRRCLEDWHCLDVCPVDAVTIAEAKGGGKR